MITLTLSVPNAAQAITAGYDSLQVLSSIAESGTYVALTPTIALANNTTSYTFTDFNGSNATWYKTQFLASSTQQTSSQSDPQPGYLTDLCNTVRDLLGVTTNEVSDSQIQGFSYLPTATAQVRARLNSAGATLDSLIAGGGDLMSLALGALAYYTAALLCPRMTVMVVDSEQMKDYKYQRNRQMDWTATQGQLLVQYEVYVSQAAQEYSASTNVMALSGLLLSGPTRAGFDTSGGLIAVNSGAMNAQGTPPLPNDEPLPEDIVG